MLSEIQLQHLKKLIKNNDLEYLRPHPDVYSIHHPQHLHFTSPTESKEKKRQIFYRVQYDLEEENALNKVKDELKKKNIVKELRDQILLKHIYAANWNIKKTVQRVQTVVDYHKNHTITKFDESTVKALEKGQIYTYGKDRNHHPIVVMRMDRFNLDQQMEENFNSIYYLMMAVLGFRMVPYHAEKNILIVDLNNMSLSKVPFKLMFSTLEKIQTCYCGTMQKIFVFNSSGIGNLWKVVSVFLTEAQKKRVMFIPKGQEHKILEYIDEEELEERYGGKLSNLTEYWPPKSTHESFEHKMKETTDESEEQMFFSVLNDDQFFELEGETTSENVPCSCDIY